MVLDTARPRYKENTTWLGMRGGDAVRKSTPKVNILKGIHDRFLRDPVYRESQLAIGWTEQKCKEWDELAQEDHTYKLTPEEKRRYKGQWYLTLNKAGKDGPKKLRSFTPRMRKTNWRAHPSRSTKMHTTRTRNFLRRLPVQRSSWSTYRMAYWLWSPSASW